MARDRDERIPTARALGLELAALKLDASQAKGSPASLARTQVAPRRPPPGETPGAVAVTPAAVAVTPGAIDPPAGISGDGPVAQRGARPAVAPTLPEAGHRAPAAGSEAASGLPRAETLASAGLSGDVPSAGEPRPNTTKLVIAGALAAMLVGGVIAVRVVGTAETTASSGPGAEAAQPEPPTLPTVVSAPRPEVAPLPAATAPAPASAASASAPAASSSANAAPSVRATAKPAAGPRPSGAAPAASPGIATKGEFKP